MREYKLPSNCSTFDLPSNQPGDDLMAAENYRRLKEELEAAELITQHDDEHWVGELCEFIQSKIG
jgi:uncharacterized protein HemY